MKRKLIALAADRKAALDAAEAALNAGDKAVYDEKMAEARNIEGQMNDVNALIQAREASFGSSMSEAETRDMMAERGNDLINHRSVVLSSAEIMRALRNSVTIGGTLVQPTGGDSQVRGDGGAVSSIVDLVQVQDLTGLGAYEVPYLISEMAGQVGDLAAKSGTARTASDPSFGISVIKPLEVTTTTFVDRNLAKISPANYFASVQQMALRALRRKAAALIVNGDEFDSHVMLGIKNAANKAGSAIVVSDTYSSIGVNTLDELYFAYGATSELGGQATLFLKKGDLKAIGELRGTNEKQRLFTITPNGNGNQGVIADGGMQIPYVIVPDLADGDLIYGNPLNYLLGLFGDYEIRIDESVKAVERLHTVLGDVAIGGNVIEDKGFVCFGTSVSAG